MTTSMPDESQEAVTPATAPTVKGAAKVASARSIPVWVDALIFLAMLGIFAAVMTSMGRIGMRAISLADDPKLSWHLVRSLGIAAYALLGGSTLWGIFLSSRIIKDWAPGTTSLLLHATISWLAMVLALAHATLLLVDKYAPYHITELLVPFTGPYRPVAVGFGVISAWLLVIVTVSFSLRKLIGQKAWRLLHYISYLVFALVTAHSLAAGTDSDKPGMQIMLLLFASSVALFLGSRLTRRGASASQAASQTARPAPARAARDQLS